MASVVTGLEPLFSGCHPTPPFLSDAGGTSATVRSEGVPPTVIFLWHRRRSLTVPSLRERTRRLSISALGHAIRGEFGDSGTFPSEAQEAWSSTAYD